MRINSSAIPTRVRTLLLRRYGFEVDWWSLGCVLYEMVCGLPPFWGETIKDVYKKVLHTQPRFPQMEKPCQSIIERLLSQDPAARLGIVDNGMDIKNHEFFRGLEWEALLTRSTKPPFKSKVRLLHCEKA
eukprot:490469-Prymnesium_polylepis.2